MLDISRQEWHFVCQGNGDHVAMRTLGNRNLDVRLLDDVRSGQNLIVEHARIKADAAEKAAKAGKEGVWGENFHTRNQAVQNVDISRFNFNKYLHDLIGPPPKDMLDPHAHHILFKVGNGAEQKELVRVGHAILRRVGIDLIFGKENLVWAPNRVAGQHDSSSLKNVVEQPEKTERYDGDKDDIIRVLKELGQNAASRRIE